MSNQESLETRKKDHIELAFNSRTLEADPRFYYEPLFSGHPTQTDWPLVFLNKQLRAPLWVSSMTGGTAEAANINKNLARACAEFGMGMGLGSCRPLLDSSQAFEDFNLRPILGQELPFYANLGIAQLEELIDRGAFATIRELIQSLQADGLIIHVNPLQEWMQAGGDAFTRAPLETIKQVLHAADFPIIVKEVGQGIGPAGVEALLQLPLAALDFGAFGGTNFALLEYLRQQGKEKNLHESFTKVGHSAAEMLGFAHEICHRHKGQLACHQLIISGGISDYLSGYWLLSQSPMPAVYGMASGFLAHARGEYAELQKFVKAQLEGLAMARAVLRPRAL